MTWILGSYQNTHPSLVQTGGVQLSPYRVDVMATVDTAAQYNQETVRKILAARKGKRVKVPSDSAGFMAWLTE
jgi:hypothetical protein